MHLFLFVPIGLASLYSIWRVTALWPGSRRDRLEQHNRLQSMSAQDVQFWAEYHKAELLRLARVAQERADRLGN